MDATGILAALALCLCPRFAGAAPHEDMPTVKTFAFSCSGMSVDQMRSYQIGETKRGPPRHDRAGSTLSAQTAFPTAIMKRRALFKHF